MKTKYFLVALTLLALLAMAGGASAAASQTVSEPQDGGLMFVENVGQFDPEVRFQAQASNGTLWVTEEGLWVSMLEDVPQPEAAEAPEMALSGRMNQTEQAVRGVALKLSFVGATPQAIEPFELLETEMSYFLGDDPAKWVSGAPVYAGVRYIDLYPGIDLELSGQGGQLAPKLEVRDPAALAQVRMRVEGGEGVSVMDGRMVVETGLGQVALPLLAVEGVAAEMALPEVGTADGGGFEVAAPFAVRALEGEASELGEMEPLAEEEMAAVATTLIFSTYLGGSGDERNWQDIVGIPDERSEDDGGINVDNSANAYRVGTTSSTDFPSKSGAYQKTDLPFFDAFVAKYGPTGTLLAATYLGGDSSDEGSGLFVDRKRGTVYVAGYTWSSDFPTTSGAWSLQRDYGFVSSLSSSLSDLYYSTYFTRGTNNIVVDGSGYAYLTTDSYDCYGDDGGWYRHSVTKLNTDNSAPTNNRRIWITILLQDYELSCEYHLFTGGIVLRGMTVYIAGSTYSGITTTPGAFDRSCDSPDGFVVKLDASNGAVTYGTCLGGTGNDSLHDIAVDNSGNVYVVGSSNSAGAGKYPTTANAYQNGLAGGRDAVLSVLNSTGSALIYSTYLGGTGDDSGRGVDVMGGNAYVIGTTSSSDFDLSCPYQGARKGAEDAFLAKLQTTGTGNPLPLLYGTYFGGRTNEAGKAITLDTNGYIYLTGWTSSSHEFPKQNAAQASLRGPYDAFVTRLALAPLKTTSFQDGLLPTTAYAGTRDTQVSQNSPAVNYGAAPSLNVDGDDPNGSGKDVCTLIKWDVTSIPSGATASLASITINVSNHSTGQVYELYKVKQAWDEMAATWNNQPTHDTKVLGTVGMNALGLYTINLNAAGKSVVQAWINAPATNYGFYICDTNNTDGFDFDSSEAATKANRPKLTLTWVHPAVTTSAPAEEPLMEEGAPEAGWQSLWLPLVNR